MLTIVKERLVKFAATKGLKPYLFAEKNSLASNTFANKSEISTENLIKVFTNYPELNFDWVITGRGEMILKKVGDDYVLNEENEVYGENFKEKYYQLLEKYTQCLEAKNNDKLQTAV